MLFEVLRIYFECYFDLQRELKLARMRGRTEQIQKLKRELETMEDTIRGSIRRTENGKEDN